MASAEYKAQLQALNLDMETGHFILSENQYTTMELSEFLMETDAHIGDRVNT